MIPRPGRLVGLERLRLRSRLPLVLLGGVAMGLSWQPYNWWPLLLVGLPAFTLGVFRLQRLRQAFGLGYVFGLVMLSVTINWLHVLGFPVMAALILFESLFFGCLGIGISLVTRLRVWPLGVACLWVLCEFGYSRIPFGGFGWTRIGYAAVDTPLSGFFPIVGVVGVSFLVALTGQLVAWFTLHVLGQRVAEDPIRLRTAVPAAALVFVLVGTGLGLQHWQNEPLAGTKGSVNVGIVQGNVPGRGMEAMGRARTVTNNHLRETIKLTLKVREGITPQPDFILWPENSTDIDPLLDSQTRAVVQSATQLADRPILVGAVMAGPGEDERQTTALWWDPTRGVLARYDKRNLVPFGEWIPFRDELLPVIPMLKLVGAQSIPGTKPGVLHVPLTDGRRIAVGDVICFELAYDTTVYQTMTNGAQLLMVQSNNATYGGTGQIEQQFAITRARAMESRREIAVATTNSVSGFIDRDGRVVFRTKQFTADSAVRALPLRTSLTPAVRFAPWLDLALALAGGVFLLLGFLARRRADRASFGLVRENGGQPDLSRPEKEAAE
nr:apolipoprotein N-acyltransferase [Microlunatus panaciterrae]